MHKRKQTNKQASKQTNKQTETSYRNAHMMEANAQMRKRTQKNDLDNLLR